MEQEHRPEEELQEAIQQEQGLRSVGKTQGEIKIKIRLKTKARTQLRILPLMDRQAINRQTIPKAAMEQ
jgi:hypothetical protein